jgi:hypothetical protein
MRPSEVELQSVDAIRGALRAIDLFLAGEHDMDTFADLMEREGPRVAITALVYVLGTVVDGLAVGSFGTTREHLWAELRGHFDRTLSDRETVARLFADDD